MQGINMIKPDAFDQWDEEADDPGDLFAGLYWGCLFTLGIWFTAIGAGIFAWLLIRSWFT